MSLESERLYFLSLRARLRTAENDEQEMDIILEMLRCASNIQLETGRLALDAQAAAVMDAWAKSIVDDVV